MFGLKITVTHRLSKETKRFLRELFKPTASMKLEEMIMFKVKNNNPDVAYLFSKKVTDAEGEVIDDPVVLHGLVQSITSDNPDSVEIKPDAVDNSAGTVHFGKAGVAAINISVSLADGTVLGSGVFGVTVTKGDPAAITDIGFSLAGLVDEADAPPPPPDEPPADPPTDPQGFRGFKGTKHK